MSDDVRHTPWTNDIDDVRRNVQAELRRHHVERTERWPEFVERANGGSMSTARFALFSGDYYYPLGGWDDFRSSHATQAEAQAAHDPQEWRWAHVADLETGEVVSHTEGSRGAWTEGGSNG